MLVLGRHEVDYSICTHCDFWASAEPWWLDEAYGSAISSMDTGIARRTLQCHRVLFPLLARQFGTERPFVDWASGPGLLVRLMRDSGLDYYWQDAYSSNPFAAGFEWDFGKGPAAAVSAIEVFEHVVDPVAFVEEILVATGTDTILFTQELHHGPDPEWWYLVPETGQHIAFYSERTLTALADRVGMTVRSAGWIHMLTRREVSQTRFEREVRLAPYRFPLLERRAKGFTDSDSLLIAERLRARGAE
jgi:hypothetical protein